MSGDVSSGTLVTIKQCGPPAQEKNVSDKFPENIMPMEKMEAKKKPASLAVEVFFDKPPNVIYYMQFWRFITIKQLIFRHFLERHHAFLPLSITLMF